MPICKGNHAGGVLTGHEARMLHRKKAVQYNPPAVPSVHGIVAEAIEVSRQGGKGNDMC